MSSHSLALRSQNQATGQKHAVVLPTYRKQPQMCCAPNRAACVQHTHTKTAAHVGDIQINMHQGSPSWCCKSAADRVRADATGLLRTTAAAAALPLPRSKHTRLTLLPISLTHAAIVVTAAAAAESSASTAAALLLQSSPIANASLLAYAATAVSAAAASSGSGRSTQRPWSLISCTRASQACSTHGIHKHMSAA